MTLQITREQRAANLAIARRRSELGISQAELAELSGISQSFICQLENGARGESMRSLSKVAFALGLGLHELLAPPRARAEEKLDQ